MSGRHLVRLASGSSALAAGVLVAGVVSGLALLQLAAIGLAVAAALLSSGRVSRLANNFAAAGILCFAGSWWGLPDGRDTIARSVQQGVAFALLLSVLGLMRSNPVRPGSLSLLGTRTAILDHCVSFNS